MISRTELEASVRHELVHDIIGWLDHRTSMESSCIAFKVSIVPICSVELLERLSSIFIEIKFVHHFCDEFFVITIYFFTKDCEVLILGLPYMHHIVIIAVILDVVHRQEVDDSLSRFGTFTQSIFESPYKRPHVIAIRPFEFGEVAGTVFDSFR